MIIGSSGLNFYVCAEDTEDFNTFSCDPDSQQCEFRAGNLKLSIRNSSLIAYHMPNTTMGSRVRGKRRMSGILILDPGSFVTHKDSANFCVSSENWGVIVSDSYFFRGMWAVKKSIY